MTDEAPTPTIPRNEARELVGKAIYSEAWITITNADIEVIEQHRLRPDLIVHEGTMLRTAEIVAPCLLEDFERLALAAGRQRIERAQIQLVDNWLFLWGFDPAASPTFVRATFERALNGEMGEAMADFRRTWLGNPQDRTNDLRAAMRQAKSRAGAKPQHDWPAIKAEFDRLMAEKGEFNGGDWIQADLERELLQFCGTAFNREPSESTMRERVTGWLAERAAAREAGNLEV